MRRLLWRRGGFTLVELLVVIGIMLVLMLILLPVLHMAREQAMRVQCQNNMRSIVHAATAYCTDNEGQMPFGNWITLESNAPTRGWLYTSPIKNPGDSTQVATGLLWPYLGGHRNQYDARIAATYHCPMDLGPWTSGPSEWMTSYLCNGAVVAYARGGHPTFRLDRMRPDAVWFWEASEQGVSGAAWNDGSSYPSEGESNRHVTGCCIGLFNGAVQWWTHDEYTVEQTKKPGRLWCDPVTSDGT